MTDLRPLAPAYAALLTALVDRGESTTAQLGGGRPTSMSLSKMIDLGYVTSHRDLNAYRRPSWYAITDLGRAVLEVGAVPYAGRGPRKAHKPFNTGTPPLKAPTPKAGCTHYYVIANDPAQTGTCQYCGAVRSYRPTYALAVVGGGPVQRSERFAVGVGRA